MKQKILVVSLVSCLVSLLDVRLAAAADKSAAQELPTFRFSLSAEPTGADPLRISSSESNYFLVNILRGLYFVDPAGVAQPEIAKLCELSKSNTKVRCEIKKGAKWSDGQPIAAKDFVESWRRILAPTAKGLGAEILIGVKNAMAIHKGSANPDTLGVTAISESILEVTLENSDSEFIQRLAHPALVPTRTGYVYDREHATQVPVSGPYKIVSWKSGSRIRLENNPSYDTIRKSGGLRPPVEILMIDDDETALNLYREGTLTFLRRLPTHYLKSWKDSKELFQIPVARFDYLGFGPALRTEPEFRQALASALNYEELRVIYAALGTPGCPGIAPQWMSTVPCVTYDLKRAQTLWEKVPNELKTKRWTLRFSRLGGDDVQKGMEWMQAQWKKNLGLTVELKAIEQSVYLSELRTDPPDLFRKGVGLDRSTCLAAVEIFTKGDSENFIRLDLPEYETAVAKLKAAKTESARKHACTEVVRILVERSEIVPLGRIHFSVLAKPTFTGWELNPLNHLDLSHLRTTQRPN